MKLTHNRNTAAFTRTELIFVIVLLFFLGLLLLPALQTHHHHGPWHISCINNLKQIGIAYRTFANDTGDKYPAQTNNAGGGWQDMLALPNAGAYCYTNNVLMADALGQSPKVIVCPTDERTPARQFLVMSGTNPVPGLDNRNISYFIGVGANDSYPQSILGGDRNLGPGLTPDPAYGFSPANGRGNDVVLRTNSPVSWSFKMHSGGNSAGGGNILLGDGSAQQTTSTSFRQQWQPNALDSGNFPKGYTDPTNAFRLIFP